MLLKSILLAGGLAALPVGSWAQSCEGGVYLNPQVIRGEGTAQAASAANELSEFLARSGLPVTPVVNVANVEDTLAAVKHAKPPCWVFGNPVVGLASGYRPVAVNTEEIRPAVLVLGDPGSEKDPKPVDAAKLAPDARARLAEKMKAATCFGIKSGVTTALVKAEKLCGTVVEVTPQIGLGQNYLPTKAAFEWRTGRWVGLVTRVQSAQSATMAHQIGVDTRMHEAQLVVVSTQHSSWGYGLYVRPDVAPEAAKKAAAQLASLNHPAPSLAMALDVGKSFQFLQPKAAEVDGMRAALGIAP